MKKQLKNCKNCNIKLTGRYKRYCGRLKCREAARLEHNEQCRIRNGKDKLVTCGCGCGETFTPGNKRKFATPACRKRLAYAKKKKEREALGKYRKCKICEVKFIPKNGRHVTCCPECAVEWKKLKDQRRYKNRIPATHKAKNVRWDGVIRDDDWTHKKYMEAKRKLKAKNGRTCLRTGCDSECVGPYYFCETHRLQNYQKADTHAFCDENRATTMIMG